MANSKYLNQADADAALDGKFSKMSASNSSMSVDASTFSRETLVTVSSDLTLTNVSNLDFEVVFDVAAGVSFTPPSSITSDNTIGEAENNKRRLFSFLNGIMVIGNFN